MSDEDQRPRERPAPNRDERSDGSKRSAQQPWRTEGLPAGNDRPRRPRWLKLVVWIVGGYLVLFLLTTMQDQTSNGAEAVAYTEFTTQVEKGNVAEVFARGDTIEGRLKEAASVPDKTDTSYTKFTTERPTFANDDLYGALEKSGTTVRATPVVQERGALWNLLISFAPILLLVGFYLWLFRRQQRAAGEGVGGLLSGGQKKPVDPESVRVTFADVAGIDEVEAEITEITDYLKDPDKYRRLGARAPKGVLLAGAPGTGKTLLARVPQDGPGHVWSRPLGSRADDRRREPRQVAFRGQ